MATHYHELKDRLHQHVIEMLDLNALEHDVAGGCTAQLTKLIEQLLQQESVRSINGNGRRSRRTLSTRCLGWVRWSRCWRTRPSTTFS